MEDWKRDRIESAVKGQNPTVLIKMRSGFAVMGDKQFLPGYCVLLAYPRVNCLNDLTIKDRSDFLVDMSLLGDAISDVCRPLRVNYSIYGNTDAILHAHVFPRYEWEPEDRKPYPVWLYPKENWTNNDNQFTEEKHGDLKKAIAKRLNDLMDKSYPE